MWPTVEGKVGAGERGPSPRKEPGAAQLGIRWGSLWAGRGWEEDVGATLSPTCVPVGTPGLDVVRGSCGPGPGALRLMGSGVSPGGWEWTAQIGGPVDCSGWGSQLGGRRGCLAACPQPVGLPVFMLRSRRQVGPRGHVTLDEPFGLTAPASQHRPVLLPFPASRALPCSLSCTPVPLPAFLDPRSQHSLHASSPTVRLSVHQTCMCLPPRRPGP